MKNFSYIFPNGDQYFCTASPTENHINTVKAFIKGISLNQNKQTYSEISSILSRYYYNHYSYNYDDFAIFTLGWIKVTSHYKTTFCYAGYDFQYKIIDKMYIPNCILDEIPNNYNYPLKILDLNFKKIILDSFC